MTKVSVKDGNIDSALKKFKAKVARILERRTKEEIRWKYAWAN